METTATCKKLQDPNTQKVQKNTIYFDKTQLRIFAAKQHLNEMQDYSIPNPNKARRADVSKMLKENTSIEQLQTFAYEKWTV